MCKRKKLRMHAGVVRVIRVALRDRSVDDSPHEIQKQERNRRMKEIATRNVTGVVVLHTGAVIAFIMFAWVGRAFAIGFPDLTVTSVSGPATAVTGTLVQIIVTVQNLTNTASGTTTKIYLSTNNIATAAPQWSSYAVPPLAVGTSYTKTNSLTVPT